MPQHQVIPPNLATPCVTLYQETYSQTDDVAIANSYTHTVSFNAIELQEWIAAVVERTGCTKIEMRLAMYTEAVIEAYPELAGKEGRLTAFLYPNDNTGQTSTSNPPIGAFNYGETGP